MRFPQSAVKDKSCGEKPGQAFLQPLALALVCILLIVLLVFMRWMDLRGIDNTLIKYMEDRGISITRNLKYVAEIYRQQLIQADPSGPGMEIGTSITDDAWSLQESFVLDLLESAQEIDYQLETGPYDNAKLNSFIHREGLWLLAAVDDSGRVILNNRPVPTFLIDSVAPMLRGQSDIRIDIFNRSDKKPELRWMAVRRKAGKGLIILAMDDSSFGNRILRSSLRRALQDIEPLRSVGYLSVMDRDRQPLAQIGEPPEIKEGRHKRIEGFMGDKADILSQKITYNGKRYLDMISSLDMGNGFIFLVRLGLPSENPERILRKSRRDIMISMVFMIIITVLSMWLLYKNQNRHLGKSREMEKRLQDAERLSSLGRLASGVAHEIRNPLNAISMAAQRLGRENILPLKRVIIDETRRLNGIIEEFLSFSRSRKLTFERHDLVLLVQEIAVLFEEEARSRGAVIEVRGHGSPVFISMDSQKLKQAFINLVKNAIESVSGGGLITIGLESKIPGRISVTITDTGPGLRPEETAHIFDLDYTTKEKGLGLGLPLAQEIIRGHGGEIHVKGVPGRGTTFEVLLPTEKS